MSDEPMIRFEAVNKSFGSFRVLFDINAEVKRGQVVVICGPSGSSKTMLLRSINGLEAIDSGRILVDGCDIHGRSTNINHIRRRIGFVFQQYNLFPHMTVARNLMLAPVKKLGLTKEAALERARALLERVGLADKEQAYPAHLSGGQQQRIAIARAMAMDPAVLLLDEPTSALDPELSAEVLDVVRTLARSGITLVCVTHEMRFARSVADVIWFMEHGQILEKLSPDAFFDGTSPRRAKFLSQIDLQAERR
jgi:polar amino acid transport system ATP-binding protein